MVHDRYPDFAEEIRKIAGKATRKQRDEKHGMMQQERDKNRKLRELVASQIKEIAMLALTNESLRAELALQKAIAEGKVAKGPFGGLKARVPRR